MERKIALVTGASKGIGRSCAEALDAAGFQVVVHYNSGKAAAEDVAGSLKNDARIVGANLGSLDACDEIYAFIKKEMGGQVDVLVNNAGVALDNPIFNASVDDFDTSVAVNLKAAWYLLKRLSRFMIRKKSGRIINMSSVIATMPNPTQAIYGMTKAGLESLTKTAAIELAEYNILVNAVAPGFIQTDMTDRLPEEHQKMILENVPLRRMGEAKEIAEVVTFLASAGSYITGTVIAVNGGLHV